MVTSVQETVKVLAAFDNKSRQTRPIQVVWNSRVYQLGSVDFLHVTKKGIERVYHFSLCTADKSMYLKLAFYTHTLTWVLEEIEDEA